MIPTPFHSGRSGSGFVATLALLFFVVTLSGAERRVAANAPPALKALQQQIVSDAVGTLLNNQLPLKLDASATFPTVPSLPGGPFNPQRLVVTSNSVTEPLPPGDYTIRAVAFCSEYSVHRAGAGVAYQVGPMQGRAADAIGALYWRGTMEKHLPARSLLVVGWSIQSGVTYAKMPKPYQAIIDDVIPDYRNQLAGDFIQNLEDFYTSRAKAAGLPPLNTLLAKLGKSGELVMSANRQRQFLLRKNTNDQIKDQVLFAGQEQRIAAVKPEEGPWSVRVPAVAYVRYRVIGGNGQGNNEIQIRILPTPASRAESADEVKAVFASYSLQSAQRVAASTQRKAPAGPSVRDLTGDGIGYSTSHAAQVLYFVPVPDPEPKPGETVGKASAVEGTANLTRNGQTRPLQKGDEIQPNDTITTGADGRANISFPDGTAIFLAQNSNFKVEDYVYMPDEPSHNRAHYSWFDGGFSYVSGLIGKKGNPDVVIDTVYGCIGIRGTEFIGQLDATAQVATLKLIKGTLECSPRQISTSSTQSGPITIGLSSAAVTTSPLTLQHYNTVRPTFLIR